MGKIVLEIIFRLQVQIPNFSELIIYTGTVFPGNRVNSITVTVPRVFCLLLRASARRPSKPDKA